jgi:hypothetical protein
VDQLPASAACVLLGDDHGRLTPAAMSGGHGLETRLLQAQTDGGPCLDCYDEAAMVANLTLADAQTRWPTFAARLRESDFTAAYALPLRLRLRGQVIGVLALFAAPADRLPPAAIKLGQALADAAAIGILHHRTADRGAEATAQLQHALTSRIVIEQAKGILTARRNISFDDAFAVLRRHARDNGRLLADVAREVTEGAEIPDRARESGRR